MSGSSRRAEPDKSANRIDAQETWNAAKEAVDDRINELARELRSFKDPQLDRIAETGLFGVMRGGETVTMATALQIYGKATPPQRERAVTALRMAIAKYRGALGGNPRIKLLDENPLGIKVDLAATMGRALEKIEAGIG